MELSYELLELGLDVLQVYAISVVAIGHSKQVSAGVDVLVVETFHFPRVQRRQDTRETIIFEKIVNDTLPEAENWRENHLTVDTY